MLSYPVRLVPTKSGEVRAVFPDVPQAVAEGRDEEDALSRAKFVLEMCLGHMLARGELPPRPSDICGAPTVTTGKFTRVRDETGC
ncbi:MAG TPA: type II toxin-antitoxin system HicB family antitoxin [Allosphingosinicella sp.]|jgi:antitoxin HicB|nr:type II toxin-antitoxin system HicB family antitoxin [Allosphingosinicella sp.]